MRGVILALTLLLSAIARPALADRILFGNKDADAQRLIVWAATDIDHLQPLIEAFLKDRPELAIEYQDMQSRDLYENIRKGGEVPDIAISSAADLQVKLVNDGFAQTHHPPSSIELPHWARWRDQAFGVVAEPAVIVYNKRLATFGRLPRTRLDLAALIADRIDLLRGRVATYDIATSGIGYLFAAEDSFYSSTFTTLMQAFGEAEANLYCCSAEMLDHLDNGSMLVGYNVLGSYALARQRAGSPIEIVLPQDYTLILSRVALIPASAKRPDLGGYFLDFLLSPEGQAMAPKLADYQTGEPPAAGYTMHPIVLNPSILVFLDRLKQARFIQTWRRFVTKNPAGGPR